MNNYELLQEKNNLIEHLRITTENLQIVNEELSNLLKEKERVLEELRIIREKKEQTEKEIIKLIEVNNFNLIEEKQKSKRNFEISELSIVEAKKKAEEIIGDSYIIKDSLIKDRTQLLSEIEKLTKSKMNLLEENNLLDIKLKDKQELLSKTENQLIFVEKELAPKQIELDDINKSILTNNKFFIERKAEIDNKIAEQVKLVEAPMKNLDEREKLVSKREKNLLILSNRFKQKFEKVFPGQNINLN